MTIPLSKRWAIVLVASLAINLFLIGAVVAGFAMRGHGSALRGPGHQLNGGLSSFSMPFAIRALGREVRPVARETFRKHRNSFKANRRALAEGREEALKILAAENFDQATFHQTLVKLQQSEARARLAVYGSIAELTGKLDGEQRQRLANAILEREQRRREFIKERRRKSRGARKKFEDTDRR